MKNEVLAALQEHEETTAVMTIEKELVKGEVKYEVKAVLQSEKDGTLRARNLILTSVPKPDTYDMDIGKTRDFDFVSKLFTSHMMLNRDDFRITDTTRLYMGKNTTNTSQQQESANSCERQDFCELDLS